MRKDEPRRNVAVVLMRLEDCYQLLDMRPGASDEELKAAHRDLTKVWHPDRFGNDPLLRRKAEEKLKSINEAYETILTFNHDRSSSRFRSGPSSRPASGEPHARPMAGALTARYRTWAITCALAAGFFLLRRPTAGGLVIALALLIAAIVLFVRIQKSRK